MRTLFLFITFTITSLFQDHLYAQPTPVKLRILSGYNIAPKILLQNGANFFVITKQKMFDKTFGIDKGTPPLPEPPDFNKEIVIVMAGQPTTHETVTQFTGAMHAGSFIEVYCNFKRTITPLTYISYPLVVAALPKMADVNEIRFYEGSKEQTRIKTK